MKNLKKFFPQESSPIIKLILRFKSWIYNAPVPPEIKTSKNRSTELTSVKSICGKCGMEIPWVEQNRRVSQFLNDFPNSKKEFNKFTTK